MLVNDFFSLLLIPSLLTENGTSTSGTQDPDSEEFQFPDIFDGQRRSEAESRDPLLAKVNDEVRRLQLDFPDDYFDHLEDNSGEVRSLIRRRKQALELEDSQTSTIVTPTPTITSTFAPSTTPLTTTSTTTKSGILGSAVNTVKKGAGSIVSHVSSPFTGGGLFGKKTTTTTTTTTTTSTTTTEAPEQEVVPVNCTLSTQIFFKGECRNLLQKEFCQPTQWLVEDPVTLRGKCVENPCSDRSDTAPFGKDHCTKVGTDKECHAGMRTYIYRSGVVECDCKEGFLYNKQDGHCYEAYKRGPCSTGQYFIILKQSGSDKGEPECLPNPCALDGYFCNAPKCPKQRNCEQLGSPCGQDSKAQYVIDPVKFTPYCNEGETSKPSSIIGNVPTLSCAQGSRRDILGNCRTPTTIDFS